MKRGFICIFLTLMLVFSGCNKRAYISYYDIDSHRDDGMVLVTVYGANGKVIFSDTYTREPFVYYESNRVLAISVPYAIGQYVTIYVDVTNGDSVAYADPIASNGKVVVCVDQIGDCTFELYMYSMFDGPDSEPLATYEYTAINPMPNMSAIFVITNASIKRDVLYLTRYVDKSKEETITFWLPYLKE